jgi:hypothetical protein
MKKTYNNLHPNQIRAAQRNSFKGRLVGIQNSFTRALDNTWLHKQEEVLVDEIQDKVRTLLISWEPKLPKGEILK